MTPKAMTYDEFATRYCETQLQTPEGLKEVLKQYVGMYQPIGFFMAEAQLMDSSFFRNVVVIPYGPNNTFKQPPTHPFSPRGLASDTSIVIATLSLQELGVQV